MLCLAPLLLALAGGTALLSPTPWQTLASIALLLSTVATAGVLQLVCFLCAARSRFTWDPRRFAILMLAAGNFFGWFLLPLVVLVSLPFALLTSGGYLALAGLIWLCFRRHYHNQMDFMDPAYLRTR
jgi:hypothetical protein